MLVGPRRVWLLDEISTGLDAATLHSLTRTICHTGHSHGVTMVVSMLQPPPEVYGLFDDVILMAQG